MRTVSATRLLVARLPSSQYRRAARYAPQQHTTPTLATFPNWIQQTAPRVRLPRPAPRFPRCTPPIASEKDLLPTQLCAIQNLKLALKRQFRRSPCTAQSFKSDDRTLSRKPVALSAPTAAHVALWRPRASPCVLPSTCAALAAARRSSDSLPGKSTSVALNEKT